MDDKPYRSLYYERNILENYEMFGNIYVPLGQEIYLFVEESSIPWIEFHRYSISNWMNVFDHYTNKFVSIRENIKYSSISLKNRESGKYVDYPLHRLYMLVFCYIDGCENYHVNHIDGDTHNNHPSNLEWVTTRENTLHALRYNLKDAKISLDDKLNIIEMLNNGINRNEVAELYGITPSYVSEIRNSASLLSRFDIDTISSRIIPTISKESEKYSDSFAKEIAEKYNNGKEYYELALEYGYDRSHITKTIKKYAKTHPEITLRRLKIFSDDDVESICRIFDKNHSKMTREDLYSLCIDTLGFDDSPEIRKALSNIFVRKTYKYISSKYSF